MAIMEENLEQQLAGIVHEPPLQVFIDVRKACNYLDRGRCMEILRGIAWVLIYRGYYIGTGMDRRWYRRQESVLGVLLTQIEE